MSDARPLAGRVAFVTGAARGIGRAIALGLAEANAVFTQRRVMERITIVGHRPF